MNYYRIYINLINKAKSENRLKYTGTYYEAHHIKPICMGGQGKASNWRNHENIVLLTAKEHLLAHLLLCEIYPDISSLKHAVFAMINYKNVNRKNHLKPSIRLYERFRLEFSNINSILKKGNAYRKGIKFTNDAITKIRLAQLGTKQEKTQCPHCNKIGGIRALKQFHFDKCKSKPGNENNIRLNKKQPRYTCPYCNKFIGTKRSLEKWHINTCNSRPNKPPKKGDWSDATNKRRSDSMKGKNTDPHKIVECPHCNKTGGHSIMQRHHFNNCKNKINK